MSDAKTRYGDSNTRYGSKETIYDDSTRTRFTSGNIEMQIDVLNFFTLFPKGMSLTTDIEQFNLTFSPFRTYNIPSKLRLEYVNKEGDRIELKKYMTTSGKKELKQNQSVVERKSLKDYNSTSAKLKLRSN